MTAEIDVYKRQEEECEEFLKELAEKTPNSRKNPYKDVKIIYEDYAQNPDEDFIAEFQPVSYTHLAFINSVR